MLAIKCHKCGAVNYSSYDGTKCGCGASNEKRGGGDVPDTFPSKVKKHARVFFGEMLALINCILL